MTSVAPSHLPSGHESVLIHAPTGRDAFLIANVLQREGITSESFAAPDKVFARLGRDAGALLLAEEAITPPLIRDLNIFLEKQEPWSDIPVIVMTSGGETTLASLRVLRAFAPSGNVTLLERPFRSITLVSALQVALRARRRQYEVRSLLQKQAEATRVRDEFISVASHELKTPLTSLKLQAQLSKRQFRGAGAESYSRERVDKLVDSTERQVDRLVRLVEDMLDISRITTGKLAMQKGPVDLEELASEVVERISPQIAAAGCELHINLQSGINGHWDRFRIEQVITNLLTNAVRYSPGRPVWVSTERDGQKARLTIRDEGPGIAKENQERIFQRFERAVNSRSISGLGLGLYICREIAESHGGTINVQSSVGEGASFVVELPLG